MSRSAFVLVAALAALAAPAADGAAQARPRRPAGPTRSLRPLPPLPDETSWGTHVLALARAPDGTVWVGTYGHGIFMLPPDAREWTQIRAANGLAWDFVHAFAFSGRDVWYGTIGGGFGVSRDRGRTWQNWTGEELGKQFLYVTPNGILANGDTVYVGTADGIRWSADRGRTWRVANDSTGQLPNRYVLALAPARGAGGALWVSTLRGVVRWDPAGTFRRANPDPAPTMGRIRALFPVVAPNALVQFVPAGETCIGTFHPKNPRIRTSTDRWDCMTLFARGGRHAAVRQLAGCEGVLCAAATNAGALLGTRVGLTFPRGAATARSRDAFAVLPPPDNALGDTVVGTACGLVGHLSVACAAGGDSLGVRAPAAPLHTWFGRPIAATDQPYIDQTYRYGSTMGGGFQQHQGVEFNNPAGTTVLAVEAGTVVHAGPAERNALTVAIRHDSVLTTATGTFFLYSVFYHNSALLVRPGQRVARGAPIARVGSTGRATNDHLHLEVHASPVDSVLAIVDPANRFPSFTRNPELWIEPLPGTGVVAGRVVDAEGRPVPQARVYGLVKPEPQETPFSFAETYGDRAHPDPAYDEHFAVGDVPAGEYVLGVDIAGTRVFRRIRVEPGRVTWVEFWP